MKNWTQRLKPDTLTKILFLVFFVASGLLVFLFLQLGGNTNIDSAQAAGPYDYKCTDEKRRAHNPGCAGSGENYEFDVYCNNSACNESPGNCIQRNGNCINGNATPPPTSTPTPTDNPGEWPNGSVCKYPTGGGSCASATFRSGSCNPGDNQMCYCRGSVVYQANGMSYLNRVENGSISCQTNPGEDLCARYGPGLHSGDGTRCNNPYRCPGVQQTPTPTTTPTPSIPTITTTPTRPVDTPTPTITITPPPRQVNLVCERLNIYNSNGNLLPSGVQLIPGQRYRLQVDTNTNPRLATRYAWSLNGGGYTLIPNPDQNPQNCATKGNNFNDIYNPTYVDFVVPTTMQPGQTISFRGANVYKVVNGQLTTQTVTACPDNDSNTDIIACGAPTTDFPNGQTAYRTANGYVTDRNSVTQRLAQLNTTCSGSAACERVFTIAAQPQQNPDIEILKTLVGPNFQPVGSTIIFNINVRNTGNVDIRNFTLTDNYDPSYLEFISSTYRGQNLSPDTPTGQIINGRRQLTWSNMPPKSTQIPNEDGVLTAGQNGNGEVFTLTLTFRILRETTPSIALENDNCGVISTIQYIDNLGQTREVPITSRASCAEFQTPSPTPLNVIVNKTTLTPSVVSPAQVRFRATITNNDSRQRTYTDIDFNDEYDTNYLRPNTVIITNPAGRQARLTGLSNTGVLSIPNLQDLCDGGTSLRSPCSAGSNPLGPLPFNQAYSLELVFDSMAPIPNTCDEVFANVTDNGGNGGVSNRARACAEITAPPPPVTGANPILNLLLPGALLALSGAANFALLKRF